MNIEISGQIFRDVQIPILWGDRAILSDASGRLSVINLGGSEAYLEVLGDDPAPGVKYQVTTDGFKILRDTNSPVFQYNRKTRTFSSMSSDLPDIQLSKSQVQVGGSTFSANLVRGFGVGIIVTEEGIGLGAPLPRNLARLSF